LVIELDVAEIKDSSWGSISDRLVIRDVSKIVHAITGGGEGGLETRHVAFHAFEKTAGSLAAPAILAAADFQLGQAGVAIHGIQTSLNLPIIYTS
jgi:hypothetical protein